MDTVELTARCRTIALWAGPLAAASVALVIAAEITSPGMLNPLGTAGAVAGLLAGIALVVGTVGLHLRHRHPQTASGDVPFLIMLAGSVLAAGGMWDQVFTLPVLAANAPQLLQQAHPSVLAGFLLSYGILGAGAMSWAISMRRHQQLAKSSVRWLIAGSIICFTPLPTRFFLLAIAISIVAARNPAEVSTSPDPVAINA
jgi:hypothetical protein